MQVVIHHISIFEKYSSSFGWSIVNSSIQSWQPSDPSKFAITLMINLGQKGVSKKQDSDDFCLLVTSPTGLAMLPSDEGIIANRPMRVVENYDWSTI